MEFPDHGERNCKKEEVCDDVGKGEVAVIGVTVETMTWKLGMPLFLKGLALRHRGDEDGNEPRNLDDHEDVGRDFEPSFYFEDAKVEDADREFGSHDDGNVENLKGGDELNATVRFDWPALGLCWGKDGLVPSEQLFRRRLASSLWLRYAFQRGQP